MLKSTKGDIEGGKINFLHAWVNRQWIDLFYECRAESRVVSRTVYNAMSQEEKDLQ